MKGLIFQGELENPGGIFFVFKNGPGILKTKVKEKPFKITLISTWCATGGCVHHNYTKLQLRWLFRDTWEGTARRNLSQEQGLLQHPSLPAHPVYLIHKISSVLLLSEGKAHFDLSHSTKSPISWGDEESHRRLCCPHTKSSSPVHHGGGTAPRRKERNCSTAETPLVGKFMLLGELVVEDQLWKQVNSVTGSHDAHLGLQVAIQDLAAVQSAS